MSDLPCKETDTISNQQETEITDKLNLQIHKAKKASGSMATLAEGIKNNALELLERELLESVQEIVAANKEDLEAAKADNISTALLDRLTLNAERISGMAQGIRKIINIKDPVGEILDGWQHPNGMQISKVRVPLGVVGIIYEARPNVTTDAIALAIKSGNSVVLRGSKLSWNTNLAIMNVVNRALEQTQIPTEAIQYLNDKSRLGCKILLRAKDSIDLVIPRGSESLNNFVAENSLVPVLGAGGGNCHVYIDEAADPDKAVKVAVNAKVHRPTVCNAAETILLHHDAKNMILPKLVEELMKQKVEIIGDQEVKVLFPFVQLAESEDWDTEYLDLKVSIKIVEDMQEAINHIERYSTGHSESIITESHTNAQAFTRAVNSACVYVNASTRFTDGEEFGFGAEMGISTSKLHVRGPIGARELCTFKYIIDGDGQIR